MLNLCLQPNSGWADWEANGGMMGAMMGMNGSGLVLRIRIVEQINVTPTLILINVIINTTTMNMMTSITMQEGWQS